MYFSKNPELILALCGSISSWIEENILSSTGFVGRIAVDLIPEELPLNVCNDFWHPKKDRITAYEKFTFLSVTGGVPLYLERIKPGLTAEQNIRDLSRLRLRQCLVTREEIHGDHHPEERLFEVAKEDVPYQFSTEPWVTPFKRIF